MREAAEKYKASTDEFLAVATSVAEGDLDKTDHEGWTPRQTIHHVADSEAQSYARLRRLLAEPGTMIQGYDEAKWAETEAIGYRELPVADSLAVIQAVRTSSYGILLRLTEADLDMAGVHTEQGAYTIADWIKIYTKHPLDHANQIKERLS